MSHPRFRYLRRFIARVHDDILMAFVLGLLHVLFSLFFGGGGGGGFKGLTCRKRENKTLYSFPVPLRDFFGASSIAKFLPPICCRPLFSNIIRMGAFEHNVGSLVHNLTFKKFQPLRTWVLVSVSVFATCDIPEIFKFLISYETYFTLSELSTSTNIVTLTLKIIVKA